MEAQQFLDSFDKLPKNEKHFIATEIFRRALQFDFPPLSDEELIMNAEDIFLELDKRETS
jgi:hypothetical protein